MEKNREPAPPHAPRPHHVDWLRVRHLKLLELIAVEGSLTAAAAALKISQPSATKMLHELEHAFGRVLVQRNVRGGQLSSSGARVLERLRVAIGSLDAARAAMADQPERPLLRMGALPLAGVVLIPTAVALLAERGLLPRIELHEGGVSSMVEMLCAGKVDCVIGRVEDVQTYGESRFDILPLSDEGFEVACGGASPWTRRRRVTLAQLREASWIVAPVGTYTRKVFDAAFVSMGMTPPIPEIESPSFHTSLETVARTGMLAFAPRSAVALYASDKRVRRVSLAQPFQQDYAALLTLRGGPSLPAVELLREVLKEIAGRA